jgi:pimeloyl-ACP methyl ester carboxylesterase
MLIHGYGSETGTWRYATPALSQTRRAVALDRTGFGLTSRPLPGEWEGDTPYSIDAHADEVVALMDDLGIAKTVLIGHSQGAAVALVVADEHPERVEGLVLVAPELGGRGVPAWLKPIMLTPQMRRVGPYVMDRGAAFLGERALGRAWHDQSAIPEERVSAYLDVIKIESWGVGMWEHAAAPFTYGLAGRAQALDVPVLIVAGDDDRVVGTETLRELGRALPDATYVEIDECGHIPQEECPDEFTAAVQSFVDGL